MDATLLRSIIVRSSGSAVRRMALLLCLAGMGMMVLVAPRARASATLGISRRVLALYYPWYGTPNFSGQWLHQDGVNTEAGTIASHTHYPLSGPYDSTDPALIERHLRQAKAAGIDTLVCSWWGRNDPTDAAIRTLLQQAPKHAMTICVLWEPYHSTLTEQDARNDLNYLLRAFGKQPGYLRCSGKPVVFLYSKTSQSLTSNQWAGVIGNVSRQNRPGVLAMTDNGSQPDTLSWSGSYTMGQITGMGEQNSDQSAQRMHQSFQARLPRQKQFIRPTVETIEPGYDDRRYNATTGIGYATLVDRQNGQRYRSLWEQALRDSPDWILIDSFNEWHNGTEIEPSRELGDQYLQMTRTYAQRFKTARQVQKNSLSPETQTHSHNGNR